jgi:hypothetical protein
MIPVIKDVLPLPDYLLQLTFDNGEKRQFDMKPYLDLGIFKELKDLNKFKMVRVSFDSIEWENEADMDPEILYAESISL